MSFSSLKFLLQVKKLIREALRFNLIYGGTYSLNLTRYIAAASLGRETPLKVYGNLKPLGALCAKHDVAPN